MSGTKVHVRLSGGRKVLRVFRAPAGSAGPQRSVLVTGVLPAQDGCQDGCVELLCAAAAAAAERPAAPLGPRRLLHLHR